MAAPSIPNLASLRPKTGLRGRGRGRGGHAPTTSDHADASSLSTTSRADLAVQQTDSDAASSRMSAVNVGYLTDPYASFFAASSSPRRYPLINRGTYVRTTAIDRLVTSFLASGAPSTKRQIISLGAGSDTRFFRLARHFPARLVYHELDFPANTATKIRAITEHPALRAAISDPELALNPARTCLHSSSLNLHPLDLRLPTPPRPPNLDPLLPTLLLSECCLTYLPPPTADALLAHILTEWLDEGTPAGIVLYEPIGPDDAFGRTMARNLAASRGLDMPGVRALPDLAAQRARLARVGFGSGTGGWTVGEIYKSRKGGARPREAGGGGATGGEAQREEEEGGGGGGDGRGDDDGAWIGRRERERVEALEWIDEVEEWELLAGHYCIVWGWRDGGQRRQQQRSGDTREGDDGGGDGGGLNDCNGDRDVFSRAWAGIPDAASSTLTWQGFRSRTTAS